MNVLLAAGVACVVGAAGHPASLGSHSDVLFTKEAGVLSKDVSFLGRGAESARRLAHEDKYGLFHTAHLPADQLRRICITALFAGLREEFGSQIPEGEEEIYLGSLPGFAREETMKDECWGVLRYVGDKVPSIKKQIPPKFTNKLLKYKSAAASPWKREPMMAEVMAPLAESSKEFIPNDVHSVGIMRAILAFEAVENAKLDGLEGRLVQTLTTKLLFLEEASTKGNDVAPGKFEAKAITVFDFLDLCVDAVEEAFQEEFKSCFTPEDEKKGDPVNRESVAYLHLVEDDKLHRPDKLYGACMNVVDSMYTHVMVRSKPELHDKIDQYRHIILAHSHPDRNPFAGKPTDEDIKEGRIAKGILPKGMTAMMMRASVLLQAARKARIDNTMDRELIKEVRAKSKFLDKVKKYENLAGFDWDPNQEYEFDLSDFDIGE